MELTFVGYFKRSKIVRDYDVNNFSEKVVKIIGGYINKILREVWKKY